MKLKEQAETIEDLFKQLSIPLTKFANHILRNNYDAQDMVAETFVRAIEHICIYNELPGKAFYFKVIRNLSIDTLRRKKRITYMEESEMILEAQDQCDVFEEVYERITEELFDQLLKQLCERYANVFYLRYQCDLSFKEIGSIMEIDEGNARILYHRARKKIATLYEVQLKEELS